MNKTTSLTENWFTQWNPTATLHRISLTSFSKLCFECHAFTKNYFSKFQVSIQGKSRHCRSPTCIASRDQCRASWLGVVVWGHFLSFSGPRKYNIHRLYFTILHLYGFVLNVYFHKIRSGPVFKFYLHFRRPWIITARTWLTRPLHLNLLYIGVTLLLSCKMSFIVFYR